MGAQLSRNPLQFKFGQTRPTHQSRSPWVLTHLQIGKLNPRQIVLGGAYVQPQLEEQLELLYPRRGRSLRSPLGDLRDAIRREIFPVGNSKMQAAKGGRGGTQKPGQRQDRR